MQFTPAFAWSLARPEALLALVLPLAIALLSVRRERPRVVPLGTARFFERDVSGERAAPRRHLSGARIAAIVALVVGTLAAAAPRPSAADAPTTTYFVYVDRSPSAWLPGDPSDPSGPTRLELALASLRSGLARRDDGEVSLHWRDASAPYSELAPPTAPEDPLPPAVLTRPRTPVEEPLWPALDRAGAVFVTDRAPERPPRAAGVFASGGPAVPGPVAVGRSGVLEWTGDAEPLVPTDGTEPPRVAVERGVPSEIDSFVRFWAEERGVASSKDLGAPQLLVRMVGQGGGAGRSFAAGRDGWRADFRSSVAAAADAPGSIPWLVDDEGRVVVSRRPGAVDLHFSAIAPDPGRAADFAVSWGRLLDGALTLPAGVVPIEERRSAGAAFELEPVPAPDDSAASRAAARARAHASRRTEFFLCALAALAATLALVLRTRGSP